MERSIKKSRNRREKEHELEGIHRKCTEKSKKMEIMDYLHRRKRQNEKKKIKEKRKYDPKKYKKRERNRRKRLKKTEKRH